MPGRGGGPWPLPPELSAEPIRFEGNTGADVRGHWFPTPVDEPRGIVVLVHPDRRYGQHWFVRTGWVAWLQDNGYDAITFDLPSYGASHGPATYYGEDVLAAVTFARHHGGNLPIHVVGLSLGAFVTAVASPWLDEVDSLVLESPYPTFNTWYGAGWGRRAMDLFDRLFPRTAALIDATRRVPEAKPARILVAATASDEVTPVALSREVADALPPERTHYLELEEVGHLELFEKSAAYREAVLATLAGEPTTGVDPAATARARRVGPDRALAPRP